MNKKSTIAFAALAATLLLASCNKGGSDTPVVPDGPAVDIKEIDTTGMTEKDMPNEVKTFNTAYGSDPTTFKSYATNKQPNSQHIANFLDGLVENDTYGRLVPSLAKSIPTPENDPDTGKSVYTFELKDDIYWSKWSDGKLVKADPITAKDFELAARLSLHPDNVNGGTSYLYFMFIENSYEFAKYASEVDKDGKRVHNDAEIKEYFDTKVGVKAIDDKHIQYTLPKPMDYFPTVLTYQCYYPVASGLYNSLEDKKKYGTVNGDESRNNLWYSGAFALSSLQNNNHIDYVKNPHYWDAKNVHLDKVHHIIAPQEADMSWGKNTFLAGDIDSFTVKEVDQKGWETYVTGADKSHDAGDPIDPYANAIKATPEGSTFYLGYNFHRTEDRRKNTDLSNAQIDDFEKAIANSNFRKAILYATNKGVFNRRNNPSDPNSWNANTFTVPTLAVDDKGRDYVDYIADEFALQNDMTFDEAKAIIGSGKKGVYNPDAAKVYLELAKAELGDTVTYPINFEIIEQQNEQQSAFYNEFTKSLQNNLDPDADIIKVSTKQCTSKQMDDAFNNHDYSVASYFGWGPDYGDPLSFLNTVTVGGDLTPNFGFEGEPELANKVLGTYTNLVEYADSLTDKADRLKAYAKAEYYLLFDQALLIPMMERFQGISVTVTKLRPKTGQLAPYGQARDKLKGTIVYDQKLTKKQFAFAVKKWEDGKKA